MKIKQFEVDNIIFDLGGVILDIDIKSAISKFAQIGIGHDYDGLGLIKNNQIFLDYEIGIISTDDFRKELMKMTNNVSNPESFDKIWNDIIIKFPKENIEVLEKVKSSYQTFLMSNTNELHYIHYNNMLKNDFGYPNLDSLFEKTYYSHISNLRKPDRRFYELILKENNLIPEKTLFIDDFIENIEAASSLGIKTLHLKEGLALQDFF